MRWRAEGERWARLVAIAALLLLAWRPVDGAGGRHVSHVRDLPAALGAATRGEVDGLDLVLDSLPGRADREWMAALRRAGSRVTIGGGDSLPRLLLHVEAIPEPTGVFRSTALTSDSALLLDTLGAVAEGRALGAASWVHQPVGAVLRLAEPRGEATAAVPPRSGPGRVLVVGSLGWESRFIAVALEEAGWEVERALTVSPGVRVEDPGARAALDTATHAAVVLVGAVARRDSTVSPMPPFDAPALRRFVQAGGGLVVVGGALDAPALRLWLPGRAGGRLRQALGALASGTPRDGLPARALDLAADAVPMERRRDAVVVAARREVLGRVVAIAFDETWPWRMQGGDGAPAAHAAWWSGLVASATRAPQMAAAIPVYADPAPWVAMRALMSTGDPARPRPFPSRLPRDQVLLAIALAALLFEWASRRQRGLR